MELTKSQIAVSVDKKDYDTPTSTLVKDTFATILDVLDEFSNSMSTRTISPDQKNIVQRLISIAKTKVEEASDATVKALTRF